GVSIILNKAVVRWDTHETTELIPGHAIGVSLKHCNDDWLHIIAVYAPSGDNQANSEFWPQLQTVWRARHPHCKIHVLLGDLNMTEAALDHIPSCSDDATVTTAFSNLKNHFKLADGWQLENPDTLDYTFSNMLTSRSHIDHIYVHEKLLALMHEWKILSSGVFTDHFMSSMQLAPPTELFVGKGRQAIPAHILSNLGAKKCIMDLTKTLHETLEHLRPFPCNPTNNVQTIWAMYKEDLLQQVSE
ncbi:hypothetical protein BDQ17DRAFT_1195192, partial [Cyathus striatus]